MRPQAGWCGPPLSSVTLVDVWKVEGGGHIAQLAGHCRCYEVSWWVVVELPPSASQTPAKATEGRRGAGHPACRVHGAASARGSRTGCRPPCCTRPDSHAGRALSGDAGQQQGLGSRPGRVESEATAVAGGRASAGEVEAESGQGQPHDCLIHQSQELQCPPVPGPKECGVQHVAQHLQHQVSMQAGTQQPEGGSG